MSIQRRAFLTAAAVATVGTAGCIGRIGRGGGEFGPLTLAATTSTEDTGILGEFSLNFETRFDAVVKAIPRGTGAALRLVENGDVDASLTHAPASEHALVERGFAVNHRPVMWNLFTVVGPADDPADIAGRSTLVEVFERIAESESGFLSRGDDSGTHQRELEIWSAAGIDPTGQWYQEVGQGMGNTLVQTDQSQQYTLTDTGTFTSMQRQLDLEVHPDLTIEDQLHINQYSLLATNPDRYEGLEHALAMAYIGFLSGDDGQAIIEEFTVGGEQLFRPTRELPSQAGGIE